MFIFFGKSCQHYSISSHFCCCKGFENVYLYMNPTWCFHCLSSSYHSGQIPSQTGHLMEENWTHHAWWKFLGPFLLPRWIFGHKLYYVYMFHGFGIYFFHLTSMYFLMRWLAWAAGLGNLCMVFSQAPPCRPTTFAHGGGLQRWHSGIASNTRKSGSSWRKWSQSSLFYAVCFLTLFINTVYILSEDVIPLKWYNGDLFSPFLSSSSWVKKGEKSGTSKSQVPTRLTCFSGASHGVKIGVSF